MNDDYPYKITRQDKNLSEVEYVQVSNEVKPFQLCAPFEGMDIPWTQEKKKEFSAALDLYEVKPVAYQIDVAEQENQYFVRDIEDAMDDLTNHNAVATPLFTSPLSPEEIRQIIESLQLGKLVIDASENSWDAFDLIGSAIKLLESRL